MKTQFRTQILFGLIVAVAVVGIVWGVSQRGEKDSMGGSTPTTIKLGALYTLSGDYAGYFQGVRKAVDYAVQDFERKYPGTKVSLVKEDDRSCDKTSAVSAIQKLISVDKVQAVVGPTCSSVLLAIGPIANQANTIVMSGSASSRDVSTLGEYVFRTYPSDVQRSKKVASLLQESNYKNVAFVHETTNDAAITIVQDAISFLDAGIIHQEYGVTADTLDLRTVITKIKQQNPDVMVFVFTGVNQNVALLKQLAELGVDKPLISMNETVQDDAVLEVVGPDTQLIFTTFVVDENNLLYQQLLARYQQDTGTTDVPQYLAENYDGAMITLEALRQAGGDTKKAQELILEIGRNHQGASGIVTFDKNGDVDRPAVLMTIRDGKFVAYE